MIEHIEDLEQGYSVRAKLNAAIDAANTANENTHVPVTVVSTPTVALALAGQQITGNVPDGSITPVKLSPDVNTALGKAHDPVTVLDTSEIDLTLTGQQLSAKINPSSITVGKLDPSIGAALGQAHAPVTVLDSVELDFTLTGQQITAAVKPNSISAAKLDAAVNTSLTKANNASPNTHNHDTVYAPIAHTHSLDSLSDVDTAGALDGMSLVFVGGVWQPVTVSGGGGGAGTVTSVAATAPITVTGNPALAPTIGIDPATSSAAGSMSAADKAALDALKTHTHNAYQITYTNVDFSAWTNSGMALDELASLNIGLYNALGEHIASGNPDAHSAANISDFQASVSANANVAANTLARHNPVTVTDTATIDHTLTGQALSSNVVAGSIGATQLAASVNTALGQAHAPVTVVDSATIDLTLTGQQVSGAVIAGSIGATHLSAGVNTSLGKADLAVQPAVLVADNVDLNTVVTSGFYRLSATHPNTPVGFGASWCQMIVIRGSDSIAQIIVDWSTGMSWMRGGSPPNVGGSGVWSPWRLTVSQNASAVVTDLNTTLRSGFYEVASGSNGAPIVAAGHLYVQSDPTTGDTHQTFIQMSTGIWTRFERVRTLITWFPWVRIPDLAGAARFAAQASLPATPLTDTIYFLTT